MDQKTDVKTDDIRDQMEGTRASLGKKIEALENTVVGSVKDVAETATETVSEVAEAVEGTVETVTDAVSGAANTVRSALDFPGHVQRHPWITLGGAFVVGVLTGRLLHSSRSGEREAGDRDDWRWKRRQEKDYRRESRRSEEQGDGWLHSLGEGFEEMIRDVKSLAIGATLSFARDLLTQSASEGLKPHIAGLVDRFTSRLGAQPVEESAASSSEEGHEDDDDDEGDDNGSHRSGNGSRRQQSGNQHKHRSKKRGSRK